LDATTRTTKELSKMDFHKVKFKMLSDINREFCKTHKHKKKGFMEWVIWSEELHKKGVQQTQCNTCGYWLFPEEI
jgi:hypothetical protein